MKSVLDVAKRWLPDTFALFGGVCLVVGAFFCHPAAGWFMAGIVLVAAAIILSRGGDQA